MAEEPVKPPENALVRQIEKAERDLIDLRTNGDDEGMAVLYTGNWHDSIPRHLILSQDLNPVEKLVWQVIRLTIGDPSRPGSTPKRDELAQAVGCSPPTITTARTMLRISRWMTFCRTVRSHQGRFVGDIYLLNDMPLSLESTLEVDRAYITFLEEQARNNSNKRIRTMASSALREIDALTAATHPSELELLSSRMSMSIQRKILSPVNDSPEVQVNQEKLRNQELKEAHSKNLAMEENTQSKNFSTVETSQSKFFSSVSSSSSFNNNKYISTRAREEGETGPKQANEFSGLNDIGRWGSVNRDSESLIAEVLPNILNNPAIMKYVRWLLEGRASTAAVLVRQVQKLQSVDLQHLVLFQLIGRVAANVHGWADTPVVNPVGYLKELASRAIRGEFTPDEWALELMRSYADGNPPGFHDSPEKIEWRRSMDHVYQEESAEEGSDEVGTATPLNR